MKCPNDGNTLLITERQGIEIDYCPECRGVWLDRGELDKFIDKTEHIMGGQAPAQSKPAQPRPPQHYSDDHHDDHRHHDSYKHHRKHRKESFLGDLFDF